MNNYAIPVCPFFSITPCGEMVLEWWGEGRRKITIYVTPKEIDFLKIDGENMDDMYEGRIAGGENLHQELFKLLEWLRKYRPIKAIPEK